MDKQQAFNDACELNRVAKVRELIKDSKVNPGHDNNYCLGIASKKGHKKVVDILIDDERVDVTDAYHYAICASAREGHYDIAELLLRDAKSKKDKL